MYCGTYSIPSFVQGNASLCPLNYTSFIPKETPSTFTVTCELYVFLILCIIGILGNLLSIVVLHSDRERRNTLFLLQNLAVADTIYLILVIIRYPVKFAMYNSITYEQIYLVLFPLHQTAQSISIWTMVLVSMDRYIYVCHPFKVTTITGKKCRLLSSGTVFISGFLYNLPLFFDSCIMSWTDVCTGDTIAKRVYAPGFGTNAHYQNIYKNGFSIALMYVIPLLLLIVLNIRMVLVIKRSRNLAIRRHYGNAEENRNSGHSQTGGNDWNATMTLIIIILVFIICQTPELVFRLTNIMSKYVTNFKSFTADVTYKFAIISEIFSVINSSVNFFIYCAFSTRFVISLRETFTRKQPVTQSQALLIRPNSGGHFQQVTSARISQCVSPAAPLRRLHIERHGRVTRQRLSETDTGCNITNNSGYTLRATGNALTPCVP